MSSGQTGSKPGNHHMGEPVNSCHEVTDGSIGTTQSRGDHVIGSRIDDNDSSQIGNDITHGLMAMNLSGGDIKGSKMIAEHATKIDNGVTKIDNGVTNIDNDVTEIDNDAPKIDSDISKIDNDVTVDTLSRYMPSEWPLAAVLYPQHLGEKTAEKAGALGRAWANPETPDLRCSYCFGPVRSDCGKCGGCRVVHYCDSTCQRRDFPVHRWECHGFKNADTMDTLYFVADQEMRLMVRLAIALDIIPALEREKARLAQKSAENSAKIDENSAKSDVNCDKSEGNSAKCEENSAKCEENSAKCEENSAKCEENSAKCEENSAKCEENTANCEETSKKSEQNSSRAHGNADDLAAEQNGESLGARRNGDREKCGKSCEKPVQECRDSCENVQRTVEKGVLKSKKSVVPKNSGSSALIVPEPKSLAEKQLKNWFETKAAQPPEFPTRKFLDGELQGKYPTPDEMPYGFCIDWRGMYKRYVDVFQFTKLDDRLNSGTLYRRFIQMKQNAYIVPSLTPSGTSDIIGLAVYPTMARMKQSCDPDLSPIFPTGGLRLYYALSPHKPAFRERTPPNDEPNNSEDCNPLTHAMALPAGHEFTIDHLQLAYPTGRKWLNEVFIRMEDRQADLRDRQLECVCHVCTTYQQSQGTLSLFETRKVASKSSNKMIANEFYNACTAASFCDLTKAVNTATESLHPKLNTYLLRLRQDLFSASWANLENRFNLVELRHLKDVPEELRFSQRQKDSNGYAPLTLPTLVPANGTAVVQPSINTANIATPGGGDDPYASDDDDVVDASEDASTGGTVASTALAEVEPRWCFTTALALIQPLMESYRELLGCRVPPFLHGFYQQASILCFLAGDDERAKTLQTLSERALTAMIGHPPRRESGPKKAEEQEKAVEYLREVMANLNINGEQ